MRIIIQFRSRTTAPLHFPHPVWEGMLILLSRPRHLWDIERVFELGNWYTLIKFKRFKPFNMLKLVKQLFFTEQNQGHQVNRVILFCSRIQSYKYNINNVL